MPQLNIGNSRIWHKVQPSVLFQLISSFLCLAENCVIQLLPFLMRKSNKLRKIIFDHAFHFETFQQIPNNFSNLKKRSTSNVTKLKTFSKELRRSKKDSLISSFIFQVDEKNQQFEFNVPNQLNPNIGEASSGSQPTTSSAMGGNPPNASNTGAFGQTPSFNF